MTNKLHKSTKDRHSSDTKPTARTGAGHPKRARGRKDAHEFGAGTILDRRFIRLI
jgi:hypothetical protein